jgi:isopenicillin-N N-acyltransferase-like protein
MRRPPIRVLDLAGTPEAIGDAHGRAHAEEIRAYTSERVALVCSGSWSDGPMSRADVIALAESMLPVHERFDATLYAEMVAMAEAAGITPAEAVIVGGFTDFVDAVRAAVGGPLPPELDTDDCTAVLVPDGRTANGGYLAQTWDMHDTATDHVIMLRLSPDHGPGAGVFTTTGCLGQIGMNSAGVAVGINDIPGLDGRPSVTWNFVVRKMLRQESADAALDVLLTADLAGAHNYLILDAAGVGYDVEAMPSVRPVAPLRGDVLVHTNHALDPAAASVQAAKNPVLLSGSVARRSRAAELLASGEIDTDRLIGVTRDAESICRHATAPFHIESSGAAIMQPRTGGFWACWGPPDDNEYERVTVPG